MINWQRLRQIDRDWTNRITIVDKRGKVRSLAALLARSGDSWIMMPVLGFIWWRGDNFWSYWGKIFFLSILITGAVVQIIKWSIRRERPVGSWGGLVRKTDPHSFPSGHAAKAGLLLGLGLYLGPDVFRYGVLIYAPLMAFARTQMGIHYISDVIAGFGLGIFMSIIIILRLICI